MQPWQVIVAAGMVGLAIAGGVLLWRFWPRRISVGRARQLFVQQREHLEARFFSAASATGKPRGLRWKDCSFESDLELARDRKTGQLVALVPVTIQFEAIAGSDMEGLPAVGNLRNASAVFFFDRGKWQTTGRAVFNLNPDEALEHFKNQYERVQS